WPRHRPARTNSPSTRARCRSDVLPVAASFQLAVFRSPDRLEIGRHKQRRTRAMPLIPNRFLFRVSHPCPHVPGIPHDDDELFHLGDECRLDGFAEMDGRREFADLRLAWNDEGLAVELSVRGKERVPEGDAGKPRHSDGLSLWIDTRDSRGSHR